MSEKAGEQPMGYWVRRSRELHADAATAVTVQDWPAPIGGEEAA